MNNNIPETMWGNTLLINTAINLEFEPVWLGKKIELRYIPFSELAIPWNVCCHGTVSKQDTNDLNQWRLRVKRKNDTGHMNASRIFKNSDFGALKRSIAQFGLLKPFEVAEMQEHLDFFYGKGRYLVIDGQRRYFAIRELLNLPTEDDERKQRDSLRGGFQHEHIMKAQMQAQDRFERLSIRNHVIIPCLVYPYKTLLQMVRHCIEDKRFSEKPSKEDLELLKKMVAEGINDLNSDDLRGLCKMRSRIEAEKKSIEKTLLEIKNRNKKE